MKKLKKEIRKLPKKIMAFTMIFLMLFSYFAPITNVFALSSTTKLSVSFRDGNEGYGKVQYSVNDGASWNDITENINLENLNVTGDNLRLKIVPNNNYSVDYAGIEMRQDENNVSGLSSIGFESDNGYAVPSNIQAVQISQIEFRYEDNHGDEPSSNVSVNINVHIEGAELEYDPYWSGDAISFGFGINSNPEIRRISKTEVNYITENNEIVGLDTINPLNYQHDYNDEGTVTFHIRTQWDDVITSLKINNTLYNTPQTREALSDAYNNGEIAFDVPNVTYAETYNIEVVGRKQNGQERIMGNFAWTYDENSNEYSDDDKILHGTLDFVKAVYDNHTYTNLEQINSLGGLFSWNDGIRDTDDPTGEATFPVGTILTLRLTPDAGYQLTSFDLNGFPFEPGEEVGIYTFTIGGGNWHLGAHFTEVGNEVVSDSVNVKNGNVDINTVFENGTAKLEVNDVISMSPNRVEEFENKATSEGYEIENYLDISLYNSIYKGGKKDSNGNFESWDTPVTNLDDKATITLELENDMNGKDLIVVHEKHNGNEITGYEVIDATYNEENNTITFETDSFSNYAIASKESTETTKYTVHFDSNGGSQVEDKEVTFGNSVAEPQAPTNGDKIFDGWYEDETLTTRFDFNTPITGNVILYAKWVENVEKYTISDNNGNSITFDEEADREFNLTIVDYLTLSESELESAGIPKEVYNAMLKEIKNKTEKYGDLLSFLEIVVTNDAGYLIHEGPFNIKIKMTDEMKNYNTFKIINVDTDNDFAIETPITLEQDGEYLVGTLNHLSTYALVGSNVEKPPVDPINNPKTGDNIYSYITMMAISILGLSLATFITTKESKAR